MQTVSFGVSAITSLLPLGEDQCLATCSESVWLLCAHLFAALFVQTELSGTSLVDTNGTYHCVQYAVEPLFLVDTNGTDHCVQYTVEPLFSGHQWVLSLVDTNGTNFCPPRCPYFRSW